MVRPTKPYERLNSFEFFNAVKLENVKLARELLEEDKFLVHQYDHVTILHYYYYLDALNSFALCSEKE